MTISAGGQCGGAAGSCHFAPVRYVEGRFSEEKRRRTQALMHEAKKGIPDMALSAQSQTSHQPASFAIGPERLMLRRGFDRFQRVFNGFGVI
jgi:hypothetical protein